MIKNILLLLLFLIISFISYLFLSGKTVSDIGLGVLNGIKKMKGGAVDLDALVEGVNPLVNHAPWTDLLAQYVAPDGKVNYKGFVADKALLDNYLADLSKNPPGKNWTANDKIVYWINAYNAFTVKLIVDHYPVKSIKEIGSGGVAGSPWDLKFFKIGGVDFDLGTIEHEILRKQFAEPRIHFAINCASFSCPKLRNEAFEVATLEQQLEEQAIEFINNPGKNKITPELSELSKIFSWFESDFKPQGGVDALLKKYHADFDEDSDFMYLEYNWALNE